MKTVDFNILARAILLFHEYQSSLFTDQLISSELKISSDVLRNSIKDFFHFPVEKLVACLNPDRIKQCIATTSNRMNVSKQDHPLVSIDVIKDSELKALPVSYHFAKTSFGDVIIASATHGVCYLAFADKGNDMALQELKKRFMGAKFSLKEDELQNKALDHLKVESNNLSPVKLYLKGTPFQISVWKRLLEIPSGGLMSYSALAGSKKGSHAFGNGVGSNPVACIIPCHRAVSASGEFGEYHWGRARKAALICLEAF